MVIGKNKQSTAPTLDGPSVFYSSQEVGRWRQSKTDRGFLRRRPMPNNGILQAM